mmetsp:Transcript_9551/g.27328  ORF Transcript_9551/g.27328 Transcript_9551/m.27328 type:complete len:209 (-) Transcript_9551:273-899(-)
MAWPGNTLPRRCSRSFEGHRHSHCQLPCLVLSPPHHHPRRPPSPAPLRCHPPPCGRRRPRLPLGSSRKHTSHTRRLSAPAPHPGHRRGGSPPGRGLGSGPIRPPSRLYTGRTSCTPQAHRCRCHRAPQCTARRSRNMKSRWRASQGSQGCHHWDRSLPPLLSTRTPCPEQRGCQQLHRLLPHSNLGRRKWGLRGRPSRSCRLGTRMTP